MTTEEIELVHKEMVAANKRIKIYVEREAELRVMGLMRHAKLKNEMQFLEEFHKKPLVYKESENLWWGFINIQQEERRYNRTFVVLKRAYTSKGAIYFRPPEDVISDINLGYVGYTSHFFDRYRERLNLKNKDVAIRNFIKDILTKDITGFRAIPIPGSKRRKETIMKISDGIGLGVKMQETVIVKTFINNSQLNNYQNYSVNELQNFLQKYYPNDI
jgi:hypothetical protein